MKVAAYCGRDWVGAMRGSLGVEPVTSPPLLAGSKELYHWLGYTSLTADLLVVNLHGYQGRRAYWGQWQRDVESMALTPEDVALHRWAGTTVFLEVCHSASGHPANEEIPQAFYARGAKLVVGSIAEAYGRVRATLPLPGFDGEADRLAQLFIFWMKRRGVARALELAKRTFRLLSWPLDADDRATLESFIEIKSVEGEREHENA